MNCVILKYFSEVKSRHARKYNCLLHKSNVENGIQSNPNNVVWNLALSNLANEEYDVLSYSLNHGLATNLCWMTCDYQWNLFAISLLETICLKRITILLIEVKTVCEYLPSTLSIWITKKYLKRKRKRKRMRIQWTNYEHRVGYLHSISFFIKQCIR